MVVGICRDSGRSRPLDRAAVAFRRPEPALLTLAALESETCAEIHGFRMARGIIVEELSCTAPGNSACQQQHVETARPAGC